jgi:Transposase DDE domain
MDKHIQYTSAVFCILIEIQTVCKAFKVDRVKCGPKPIYPDSFIISLIIIKNLLGMNSESSFLRHLRNNYQTTFTKLPEQSWFNRKTKRLQSQCEALQQQLVLSHLQDRIRIVDSTPVPVVRLYRGCCTPCFKRSIETNYGYCASKKEYYYGVKLSLFITLEGVITDIGIHPANRHDLVAAKDVLKDMDITNLCLVGDKGYYDGELRATLATHGGHLSVPDKKRHTKFATNEDKRLLAKRSLIETVNEQLKSHMKIHETLAQSYAGLVSRLWSAILAFTFAQYLNRKHGRPLLAVKGLLV